MSASLPELMDKIVIDGTKVGWYPDRIAAWQRGERIAPITIDCAMTRACNAACSFCLWPDTLVKMADGTDKEITKILPGDSVASIDEYGRKCVSVVKHQWQTSPNAIGLQLHTQSGKTLKCTANHLILTENGWESAGNLRAGDYVYEFENSQSNKQTNEEKQPNEESKDCSQNAANNGEESWKRFSIKNVQAVVERWHLSCEDRNTGKRTQGHKQKDEGKQSYAKTRSSGKSQSKNNSRAIKNSIREYEKILERRENNSEYVFGERKCQRCQQNREAIISNNSQAQREVCRRWYILDSHYNERNQQESRLYIQERNRQNSTASPWRVLAQRQEEISCRDKRLLGCRVESICPLDKENFFMDGLINQGRNCQVVKRDRIIKIESAGSSPVYDLECTPHHNFIANGLVVHNCYAQLQASEGEKITKQAFFDFLDDAAEIGVKGVSFISDGESTVVPWYADAVEHASKLGLEVGAGSNGIKLTKPILERILKHLSYLRFNFSAGERKRYAEIMGVPQHCYDDVIQNIKDGMEIINRGTRCNDCGGGGYKSDAGTIFTAKSGTVFTACQTCYGRGSIKLGCTLNMQLVCDPKDADQLIPFAELACKLRPTYAVIKHCADDVEHHLGVDYSKYDALTPTFDRIEQMGKDAGVKITVKRARMDGKRTYDRCYGPPFILQLSGNGLVAPCGFLFNEKYKAFHIGNIVNERFRDVFYSDRYLEVMKYLASEHFDPRKRCGPNCLQHNTNDFLYRYVNGKVSLPTTEKPSHMGFI